MTLERIEPDDGSPIRERFTCPDCQSEYEHTLGDTIYWKRDKQVAMGCCQVAYNRAQKALMDQGEEAVVA